MTNTIWDIPLSRQNEITKVAHRKRRYFNEWQRINIAHWRKELERGNTLPEQHRFFMYDIEAALIKKGFLI